MPHIRIPSFEGPLQLLLQLIERDDLDITAVSLVSVTDQYLAAVRKRKGIQAEALAEFISIGARLIYLKSRALLPPAPDDDLKDDEVGRELVDLLLEYRRYREVAVALGERQAEGLRFYARSAAPPVFPPGPGLDDVTADRLRALMLEMLERVPEERPTGFIRRETLTLAQRIDDLRERLSGRRKRFSFRAVISGCETRIEVVIVFLAILELLKRGECAVQQHERWGDIEVVAVPAFASPV
jgi:segregation and condensation protein A